MSYDVVITSRAEQEAQQNHDWWAENRSAEQAARWYDEFLDAALSLENYPDRCALAVENPRFPYEIRQLNFGLSGKRTHRIVYTVRPDAAVVVLRVRHLAQEEIDLD
jgi:plasmid stabilization system protein ParE